MVDSRLQHVVSLLADPCELPKNNLLGGGRALEIAISSRFSRLSSKTAMDRFPWSTESEFTASAEPPHTRSTEEDEDGAASYSTQANTKHFVASMYMNRLTTFCVIWFKERTWDELGSMISSCSLTSSVVSWVGSVDLSAAEKIGWQLWSLSLFWAKLLSPKIEGCWDTVFTASAALAKSGPGRIELP